MRFAHYLGRCIYGEECGSGEGVVTNALCALPRTCLYLRRGEERKGKEIKIRYGLNQCATHITWDAYVFTKKRVRERMESLPMRFAHYLGRACIYLEERKGKEIRGGRNQ